VYPILVFKKRHDVEVWPPRFLVEDESSEVSYMDKTGPWACFIDSLLAEIEATESDL